LKKQKLSIISPCAWWWGGCD